MGFWHLVQRKQLIGVVDTSYVNSTSIFNTLDFLEYKYLRIKSYKDLKKINKLIIPGIGNFRKIIDNLIKDDLFIPLQEFILQKNFTLGICLGMQILCQHSEEGDCEGIIWHERNERQVRTNTWRIAKWYGHLSVR